MRNISIVILIISALSLVNCAKEATIQPKDYPYVITDEVSDISENSVVFNGNILSIGTTEIIEYGFLWGSMPLPILDSAYKKVLGSDPKTGKFSHTAEFQIIKDKNQFVRSYVKIKDKIVYGNSVGFKSNGGISPVINEVKPLSGYVNTRVRITGNYFSTAKSDMKVYFGDVQANIDSVSGNNIYVKVPDIDKDTEAEISVEVFGKAVNSVDKFKAYSYWSPISSFPGKARYSATSFTINNIGYVGLGHENNGDNFTDFYAYDPVNNSWTRITDFPGDSRYMAAGFSYNGKGYVAFGYSNNHYYNDIWEYDPLLNTWTWKIENPNIFTYGDACFEINGNVIINTNLMVYKYNISLNYFETMGYPQDNYRFFTASFDANNKGYMFAGQAHGNMMQNDLWEYNPSNNYWTKISELPANKNQDLAVGFSLNSRLFMGIGRNYYFKNEFYEYNLITKTWTVLQKLPGKERCRAVSFTINNKAYVGTGFDDYTTEYNDFYEFDPFKQ